MAQPEGLIKLTGRIGDLTFYKTKYGIRVRKTKGVDPKRLLNDPCFERSRESSSEFGRACTAGKVLRYAVKLLTADLPDSGMCNRLMKEMLKVIQADAEHGRGLRKVMAANTELLNGFEFNAAGLVGRRLGSAYVCKIDRDFGGASLSFAEFSPISLINGPLGATHFKFKLAVAAVDFDHGDYEMDMQESDYFLLNSLILTPITLTCNFSSASEHPIFLMLGINFYGESKGEFYPLHNSSYNGLRIVLVDHRDE